MSSHALRDSLNLLSETFDQYQAGERPVTRFLNASELAQQVDVTLSDHGAQDSELAQMALDYLHYSPDVGSPKFNKQLYSGVNAAAVFGDWVTSLGNATMHTYQVSPVATLMEVELIKQWNALVGFTDGDGVMVSGGSQANLIAMLLARHRACPEAKTKGIQQPLVAFVSDQAHYSSLKAVNVLGLGSDNLVAVTSDEQGRMLPQALQAAIEQSLAEGKKPFYIGLTAGTTVLGAYDPVEPCALLAERFGLWLHIDGAWGAPVLFSETHKSLLKGCHLADSVSWDAHKLMNVPMTAAVILVREKGLLRDACSGGGGDYLFHSDQNADYNLGERSIQCGRRADALKVWMSWKSIGNLGFARKIDQLQQLRADFVELIEQRDDFELLHTPTYLNVLFRYRSERIVDEEHAKRLTVALCQQLKERDISFTDRSVCKGRNGVRLILANQQIELSQLSALLDACSAICNELLDQGI